MARGPGWRLAAGEGGSWMVKLSRDGEDLALTWAHMLQTIRSIAETHGLRPLSIDLRDAERLCGPAAEAAALLFAEFEIRDLRVSALVGPDLVHAARLHRLMSLHAPVHGRCFLIGGEAIDWVRPPPPPVPRPLREYRRSTIRPPRV